MITLRITLQAPSEHFDYRPVPSPYWAAEWDRYECPDPEMPIKVWTLRIAGLRFEMEIES